MKKKLIATALAAILLMVSASYAWGEEKPMEVFDLQGDLHLQKEDFVDTNIIEIASDITAEEASEEIALMEEHYSSRYIVKMKSQEAKAVYELHQNVNLEARAIQAYSDASEAKQAKRMTVKNKISKLEKSLNILQEPDLQNFPGFNFEDNGELVVEDWQEGFQTILLPGKVEPELFINRILNELSNEIEYIQPDYELELTGMVQTREKPDALELDVVPIEEGAEKTDSAVVDMASEIKEETPVPEPLPKLDENLENSILEGNDILSEELISEDEQIETLTGSGVTIAVIDTGIDVTHPDLTSHIIEGYDFYNDMPEVYCEELGMEQVHGTHVAGIVAKSAPGASIMPLKCFEKGKAFTTDLIEAILFAKENGAAVVNCSWGSKDNNQALKETMESSGLLFVCAAGNNREDIDNNPIYPASFDLDNIISVSALNADSGFCYFSNYGIETVDIAAFGRDIASAAPGGDEIEMSGTSMAAGFVSAAAAIAAEAGAINLKERILTTSDRLSNLQNKVNSGRRLNIDALISNTINSKMIDVSPADDFDVHGYQPTPEENWELFCSLDNVQVEAGYNHSVALKANGTVWQWGKNVYSRLSDGRIIYKAVPVMVAGLNDIQSVAAGVDYTLALKSDGTVWAWGENSYGQLGDGTTTDRTVAMQVPNMSEVNSLDAYSHSLAIKSDGTVWGWGYNYYGALGNGTSANSSTPVQMQEISGAKQISAGKHSMVLKDDGSLWTCGYNFNGQLGDGTTTKSLYPIQVMGIDNIKMIDAGESNSLVVKTDGTLWIWGDNSDGEIGNAEDIRYSIKSPAQVTNMTDIEMASLKRSSCLAVKTDGGVWAWGSNYYGQLGDGTTTAKRTPSKIQNLTNVKSVSTGSNFNVALKTDGSIWGWGINDLGQIGDGSTIASGKAEQVINLTNVKSISACAALKTDGTVWCWGRNNAGQVGDGTTINRSIPSKVNNLNEVKSIANGYGYQLALKEDGTVWGWGSNGLGELGDGTDVSRSSPVQVSGLSDVVTINAGFYHSFAVKSDGTLWGWGIGLYEPFYGGGWATVPEQVTGLSNVVAASPGLYHGLALKSDGTVWSWGNNNYGQLGDGTTIECLTPSQVQGLSDVKDVKAGENFSVALKTVNHSQVSRHKKAQFF